MASWYNPEAQFWFPAESSYLLMTLILLRDPVLRHDVRDRQRPWRRVGAARYSRQAPKTGERLRDHA